MDEINTADRVAAILALALESNRVTNRLRLIERAMDSTLASVVIFDPKGVGRPVIYVNAAFEKATGYSGAAIIGEQLDVLVHPDTDQAALQGMQAAIAEEHEHLAVIQYRTKDGGALWSSSALSPVRDRLGRLTHYVEVINDVTPMMNAMVSLQASEERFRQLVENASDIILVIEESGSIRYSTPAVERIMGYTPTEVIGSQLIDYIHPEDVSHAAAVFIHLSESEGDSRSMELRAQRKDGTWCYLEATARNLLKTDGINAIVVNARDLSERMSASDQMDHLALHDSLTGLPNKALFNDLLGRAIADARRTETMVAVMFLDVNRFKVINDSLGHSVGDLLLKQVAERLVSTARDGDTVARWGGDEFTLIFTNVASTRDAARVAQRIINSLAQPFDIGGKELFTTVSIGISIFPSSGEDVEALVQNADTAMYRAKDEGQSSYQFYSAKMNAGAGERLALEGNLRRALERTEFELFYQPQIDIKSGRIVSAEALVRWRHPELGLVPPKDFIPLAEETGLIVPMGDWIMRAACIQSRIWHDAGYDGFRIAVNLSARQFGQRDLHQNVLRILRETNADPRGLELELTESLLINGESRVVAAMNDLTALGVTVSIDDFGIGYASYAYLKRYPVKALKIDQSFVKGMLSDTHDNAIVQSIISMAHNLGLTVIAEGVEAEEQRDALIELECDLLQGYFYGKPMPAEQFTQMLTAQDSIKK
jgi:diguanylate cyclase (GGDEF)-like protein/PAS domain S-box-containing protein